MSESTSVRRGRRVVIVGWDGLRPDLISPEVTPRLHRLAQEGVQAMRHYAAYPTETRVNAATLATGCWPGRHGIVGNELYLREAALPINTGSHEDLRRIVAAGQSVATAPCLAQRLAPHGLTTGISSAGSPGSALMWDPEQTGPVFNVFVEFGDPRTQQMRAALGPTPPRATPNKEADHYAARAVVEHYLPRPEIAVCLLWLNEPDHAQHFCGLGSPEAVEGLRDNDAVLGEVLEAIERRGETDRTDIIVCSDHGFSTIVREGKELRHLAAEADLFAGLGDPIAAIASYGMYLKPEASLAAVAERLMSQSWCGTLLARQPDAASGLLPLAEAWGGHLSPRAPDIIVSPAWDDAPNRYGVRGRTEFGSNTANHGSISPFDLRSTFIGYGPGFRSGCRSDTPAGAADLAPTVLHLLGIPADSAAPMDGRVLRELLVDCEDEPPSAEVERLVAGPGGTISEMEVARAGQAQYLISGRRL